MKIHFLNMTLVGFSLVAVSGLLQAETVKASETVVYSQLVEPDRQQHLGDRAVEAKSRVFYKKVNGKQLNAGVEMVMDGDSAVLQVTPLDKVVNGRRVAQRQVPVNMTLSNGRETRNLDSDEIALHKKSQGLREQYPEMYGRAHAARIPESLGRGRMKLSAGGAAKADDEYVVYVLDKNSDMELNVATPAPRVARNGRLTLDAHMSSAAGPMTAEQIDAELVSPQGKRYPVKGRLAKGRFHADWPVEVAAETSVGELWNIEVRALAKNAAGEPVERVAVVATSVFEPTAALQQVRADGAALQLALDVSAPGRYEVRALVYGTDYDGELKPAMLNYQAEWLQPGQQQMLVAVDQVRLAASGLSAPYEVRDIQLLDQKRMAVLESREGRWELK